MTNVSLINYYRTLSSHVVGIFLSTCVFLTQSVLIIQRYFTKKYHIIYTRLSIINVVVTTLIITTLIITTNIGKHDHIFFCTLFKVTF